MGATLSTDTIIAMKDPRGILVVAMGVPKDVLPPEISAKLGLLQVAHKRYAEALALGMLPKTVGLRLENLVEASTDLKKALPWSTKVNSAKPFYAKEEVQWTIRRFEKSLVGIGKEFDNLLANINSLPQSRKLATRFQTLADRPPTATPSTAPLMMRYKDAVKKLTATMNTIPTGPLPKELTKLLSEVNDKKEAVRVGLLLPEEPTTPVIP